MLQLFNFFSHSREIIMLLLPRRKQNKMLNSKNDALNVRYNLINQKKLIKLCYC